MNYLAHLFLSGDSESLLIGNFIADSVKGKQAEFFQEEVHKGIILHRKIDTFTDQHPEVERSKKRLREKYRKYSGVIVDIYYDHFLAIYWNEYSQLSLPLFADQVHAIIQKHHQLLPEKSKMFFYYMQRNNILNAYATKEGLGKVLYGMSRRTTFVSNMEQAVAELELHYDLFEKEFRNFFPDLQEYVKKNTER